MSWYHDLPPSKPPSSIEKPRLFRFGNHIDKTEMSEGKSMEAIDVVISLAPYEKELLRRIHSRDRLSQLPDNTSQVRSIIGLLFEEWVPCRRFWFAMRMLGNDLKNLKFTSPDDHSQAYQVFLNRLKTPFNRDNTYRADLFHQNNPEFAKHLRQVTDIEQFRERINVTYNNDDLDSWKILATMVTTLPEEMSRWTYIEDPDSGAFELWMVVRLFHSHLHRPKRELLLMDYCRNHPDNEFGKSLGARLIEKRDKFIERLGKKVRQEVPHLEVQDGDEPGHEESINMAIFEVLPHLTGELT
jgi:hypothetical protein